MNERDLRQHIKILGWLHIAGGVLFLIIGIFVFFLLTAIGAVSGDRDAQIILPVVAFSVAGLMVILAAPGILAGYGLLKGRSWGRLLAIIVGIFNLMNFPLGTAIGVYTLWVLLQNEANDYFTKPKTI